jgi:hypothetical protein
MGDAEKAITFYEIALSIDPSIDFARESLERLKVAYCQPPEGKTSGLTEK